MFQVSPIVPSKEVPPVKLEQRKDGLFLRKRCWYGRLFSDLLNCSHKARESNLP